MVICSMHTTLTSSNHLCFLLLRSLVAPSWEKKTHPSFFFSFVKRFCSLQPSVTGPVGDLGFSQTKDDALDVVDLYR